MTRIDATVVMPLVAAAGGTVERHRPDGADPRQRHTSLPHVLPVFAPLGMCLPVQMRRTHLDRCDDHIRWTVR